MVFLWGFCGVASGILRYSTLNDISFHRHNFVVLKNLQISVGEVSQGLLMEIERKEKRRMETKTATATK